MRVDPEHRYAERLQRCSDPVDELSVMLRGRKRDAYSIIRPRVSIARRGRSKQRTGDVDASLVAIESLAEPLASFSIARLSFGLDADDDAGLRLRGHDVDAVLRGSTPLIYAVALTREVIADPRNDVFLG